MASTGIQMDYSLLQSTYRSSTIASETYMHTYSPTHNANNLNGLPAGQKIPVHKFLRYSNVFARYYFFFLTASVYLSVILLSDGIYLSDAVYVKYLITYICINLLFNYSMCALYPAYYRPVQNKQLPGDTWEFCNQCQHMKPPRCRHCPLCQKCIPKRDHHCFFLSTCVGARNQGRFSVYCFYVAVGLYVGFKVLSQSLSNSYYEVFSWDFYHYFPPVTLFNFLFGHTDFMTLFLIFLLFGSLITGIFSSGMFLWQLFLIICDLTTYEAEVLWKKSRFLGFWSRLKVWQNMKRAFGPVPPLLFLIPFPNLAAQTVDSSDLLSKL